MEGPSLFLAAQLLQPFVNQKIIEVTGNTKIGKERFQGCKILEIFAWGKHLVFQFETFALRVHFMLFGSFEATVNGKKVTGDYPRKNRPFRLQFICKKGEIDMYSCSLRFIESANAKLEYDYSIDIMSDKWSAKKALNAMQKHPNSELGDVLLNQEIFAGLGNIMKNETLFLAKMLPTTKVKDLDETELKKLIKVARQFAKQFYEWRKLFELKKHYQVYRRAACAVCEGKVTKKWTGERNRVSYFCQHCQQPKEG